MTIFASILFLLLPVGEQLHYTVRFGPFRVGTLDLKINDIAIIAQESSYHFTARLKSNPGWRFLFNIDDQLESYARIRDFATLRSFKRVAESGYEKEIQADFDYQTMKIYYSDSSTFDLKPGAKDLLTLWFYFRTLALELNDTITVMMHGDKNDYDVEISVTGMKTVETGIGEYDCLELKPKTQIKQNIGIVYLTKDPRRLPAMIKNRFSFGYIVAILEKIGG